MEALRVGDSCLVGRTRRHDTIKQGYVSGRVDTEGRPRKRGMPRVECGEGQTNHRVSDEGRPRAPGVASCKLMSCARLTDAFPPPRGALA